MFDQSFQEVAKHINRHAETITRNAQAQNSLLSDFVKHVTNDEAEKMKDYLLKLVSEIYTQSSSRTRLFFTLGYVALFAVWSNTSHSLARTENILTALSLLVSCIIFVLWEIFGMITSSRQQRDFADILQTPLQEIGKKLLEIQRKGYESNVRLVRKWHIALCFIVGTGLVGTVFLVKGFVRVLVFERAPAQSNVVKEIGPFIAKIEGKNVKVFNVDTGALKTTVTCSNKKRARSAIAAGEILSVACDDGKIQVYDVNTGKLRGTF